MVKLSPFVPLFLP